MGMEHHIRNRLWCCGACRQCLHAFTIHDSCWNVGWRPPCSNGYNVHYIQSEAGLVQSIIGSKMDREKGQTDKPRRLQINVKMWMQFNHNKFHVYPRVHVSWSILNVFQYVVVNIKTHRGPLICFYLCFYACVCNLVLAWGSLLDISIYRHR